ncbi:MAG: tyrosine recombinase XerC [Alphaproteobacteria bacterium]|nr:tyrosine recombinase XerC [Alphaproteobacteria bacterium]MBL0718191.1 tyrosine recombinase XerC [Alphaproteobacteria bacterium]
MYLNEVVDQFLSYMKNVRRLADNSVLAYKRDLKQFEEFLKKYYSRDEIDIKSMTKVSIMDFRAFLSYKKLDNITATSIARKVSAIRAFFKYMLIYHNIKNSAVLILKTPRIPQHLSKALDSETCFSLIENIKNLYNLEWLVKRDQALFILLYGAGLRISEAVGLNCIDLIDAQRNRQISIIGKGNKERLVPLIDTVIVALEQCVAVSPFSTQYSDPIFRSSRGLRISPRTFQMALKKLQVVADISQNISPHSLRHSFATQLLENDVDIRYLQELLGHSSLSTTQRYTKLSYLKIKREYEKAMKNK